MFKERLVRLLEERKLNQRQLGLQAGIPPTTISGWMNAGRLPDYSVSADYFFGLEEA